METNLHDMWPAGHRHSNADKCEPSCPGYAIKVSKEIYSDEQVLALIWPRLAKKVLLAMPNHNLPKLLFDTYRQALPNANIRVTWDELPVEMKAAWHRVAEVAIEQTIDTIIPT